MVSTQQEESGKVMALSQSERSRRHYEKHRSKRLAEQRAEREANPGYAKNYYWAHREEILAKLKLDRMKNPQRYEEYQRRFKERKAKGLIRGKQDAKQQ